MKIWCSRGDAKAGGGGEKGELATIFHKFSFTPGKTAGHGKAWKLLRKHEPHQNNVFYHWLIFVFIHWKTNVNMSDRIRAQYFDSRFVYIWKVVYIQKTSKLPVAITNWRTAFSWTWFSFVLLQLLPTRFIVLLDGQLLILRQLRCNVHVTEFFYPVEFNRSKWRWKAALESGAWLSLHFHSSHFQS